MRYLFFRYDQYYPSGGMADCEFAFVDYDDFLNKFDKDSGYDYYQLLDLSDLNHQVLRIGWDAYESDEEKLEVILEWVRKFTTVEFV